MIVLNLQRYSFSSNSDARPCYKHFYHPDRPAWPYRLQSVIEDFEYFAVKQMITESRRQQTEQCIRACISLNASRKRCGMDCPRSAHFLLDKSVIEMSVYYVVRQRYLRKIQITDTRRLSAVCKSLVLRKRILNSKICKHGLNRLKSADWSRHIQEVFAGA